MTCAVCLQPSDPWDTDDFREVRFRNGHTFRACLSCWCKWPDEWKPFPSFGYGRVGDLPKFPGEEEWTRQVLSPDYQLVARDLNAAVGTVQRAA